MNEAKIETTETSAAPVNVDALKATLEGFIERADALLATQGNDAKPENAEQLFALGREIGELDYALAHAESAKRVLQGWQRQLCQKAHAYAIVFGTQTPDDGLNDFSTCSFSTLPPDWRENIEDGNVDEDGIPF